MNFLKPALSITFAICALAGASALDAAKANDADNPWLPKPAASSETSDHGRNTYCAIQTAVPFYTCDQELALNGVGEGNKEGLPAREGKHFVPPKKDECEPKGEGPGPSTGESAAAKSKI